MGGAGIAVAFACRTHPRHAARLRLVRGLCVIQDMPPSLPIEVHVPPRLADIEFRLRMPKDFRDVELPAEDVDFTNPTVFAPLFVGMASYGAVLMSVAARPAYEDGSLREWIGFLCVSDGLNLCGIERGSLNGRPTMVAEATQESDAGRMRIRTHLFEDGGRLLNVSVMAPEAIWPSVVDTLAAMQGSFELLRPRGGSTPLEPGEAAPGATSESQPEPHPEPAPASETASAEKSPAAEPAAPPEPYCRCLDPEHPTNVRLRDARVGLVPRVHEQATATRGALVAPAAIVALIRVPAGWHVLDDGMRTLVFDEPGRIQVSLNLREIRDPDAFLRTLEEEHRRQQRSVQTLITMLDRYPSLLLRGLMVNDEPLEQAFLVHPDGCELEGMMLVARVTATTDDMGDAMELVDGILRSVKTASQMAV